MHNQQRQVPHGPAATSFTPEFKQEAVDQVAPENTRIPPFAKGQFGEPTGCACDLLSRVEANF
jgi:hypothetical protein